MKIFITGIAGFAGSHLAEYILSQKNKAEIFGTILPDTDIKNIKAFSEKIHILTCDINNKKEVERVVAKVAPDRIYHLAAQSYVHSSWEDPTSTLSTNILGQSNLFEAVRMLKDKADPIILIACSSEEYGFVGEANLPIKENEELHPRSPYAISKLAQDYMGYQYFISYGMKIIRMRAFNHTGPRRNPIFFVSNMAKKIVEIEKGIRPPILEIRDLSAVRDFTDVRDIVRGYVMATQNCQAGDVYNICSGNGLRLQEILDALIRLSEIKNIQFIKDTSGTRPNDGNAIVGDNNKFKKASGWKPEIDFMQQTLPDMLAWWRKNI